MMSEFRRRLLMQNALKGSSDDLGYIKDGMILHLDGINKGDDSTAWTDLVQGVKFTKNNVDDLENGINIKGDGKSYLYNYTNDIPFPYDSTTLEFCVHNRGPLTNGTILIYNNHMNDMVYNCYGGVNFYIVGVKKEHRFAPGLPTIGNNLVSYNNDFVLVNTKFTAKSAVSGDKSPVEGQGIVIGGRIRNKWTDRNYNGIIHSIRVYNRKLTKEEMLHNQQVDIDRFFGGVVPQ